MTNCSTSIKKNLKEIKNLPKFYHRTVITVSILVSLLLKAHVYTGMFQIDVYLPKNDLRTLSGFITSFPFSNMS